MNKNQLKIQLSKLEGFDNPRVELEQYQTPPGLAADIIHHMKMQGIEETVDLGTGTGILAVGAALAGIKTTAVEVDPEALKIARENASELGLDIEFVERDVEDFTGNYESVVMNPPFNIQSDEGLTFWNTALEIGEKVYGLAGKGFEPRLEKLCEAHGHEIVGCEAYTVALPDTYSFHTENARETPVDLYVTRRLP